MGFINAGKENSTNIDLYYEDYGMGKPVILIHGWPLSSASWEKQVPALLGAGYRVVSYDRRGFGFSSRTISGMNYDVFAEDLQKLITKLDLHEITLAGFSMGGGEVARYLGKYGSDRVSKAVFISAITPCLVKTASNPEGMDSAIFDGIKQALKKDRPAFLTQFFNNFYNADINKGKKVSSEVLWLNWVTAAMASPIATLDCVTAWDTDFRNDLKGIDIPVLVLHGDSDRIAPLAFSGQRMKDLIQDCHLKVFEGAPHGLNWTHADEINRDLVAFLGEVEGSSKQRATKAKAKK